MLVPTAQTEERPVGLTDWLMLEEIPTAAELQGDLTRVEAVDDDIAVVTKETDNITSNAREGQQLLQMNKIDGPWEHKEAYLGAHYRLLREDTVAPLRNAVTEVRLRKEAAESSSFHLYDRVRITGLTFSRSGPAVRVVFSTTKAGKKIRWAQSKRLTPLSLVALTPSDDYFQQQCIVAVVAARPLAGVEANPPEVDLFFAKGSELEIDPMQEWIMVQANDGYFEAYRHTLMALQKMMTERSPLCNHLVSLQTDVGIPEYIRKSPFADLTSIFPSASTETTYENINILEAFPQAKDSVLDSSQLVALERILTKELAVVQGPPGTGKTHVSVAALRIQLGMMSKEDPPIIIASQTNHALDQLLLHVAAFEKDFIRLGGRSADQNEIKQRTMQELRQVKKPGMRGTGHGAANTVFKRQEERMKTILAPLRDQKQPHSAQVLFERGVISRGQFESLEHGAADWVHTAVNAEGHSTSIAKWLGNELVRITSDFRYDDSGLDFEEPDLEFEQLKEWEAEMRGASYDHEKNDELAGFWFPITERFTAKQNFTTMNDRLDDISKIDDLWLIPQDLRGSIYVRWQIILKKSIRESFVREVHEYMNAVRQFQVGKVEVDKAILKDAKIIGMTTTGLSKYRSLIESLKPRILMVEEAAESLEGHIAAGLVETIQHLILIGDHNQLRGSCAVPALGRKPYNLTTSMFERLVINNVEYSMLARQRRMIPEIRRLLAPIYDNLQDHPSVQHREPVPGMAGVNSFFFTHDWPESSDEQFSSYNLLEADMLVGFFAYLVLNGTKPKDITVLTFYNGQRKRILKGLRAHPDLQDPYFNVKTVDSYQGEENEVVLLSLVRSNSANKIGFVGIKNRVCVAISTPVSGRLSMAAANGSALEHYHVVTIASIDVIPSPTIASSALSVAFRSWAVATNARKSSKATGARAWQEFARNQALKNKRGATKNPDPDSSLESNGPKPSKNQLGSPTPVSIESPIAKIQATTSAPKAVTDRQVRELPPRNGLRRFIWTETFTMGGVKENGSGEDLGTVKETANGDVSVTTPSLQNRKLNDSVQLNGHPLALRKVTTPEKVALAPLPTIAPELLTEPSLLD
ncbi:MAG: hypothetical protein M1833_002941 [Piccolia ochrophora]|nr:MAG: hypothetical protein M1833_002941 [Piccolia ochrophora]